MVFKNIENQQKKKSSMSIINKFPTIHLKVSNLRKCLEANQCID